MAYLITCVCLGNICRSPMAEAVLRRRFDEAGLGDDVEVDSAGTGAWHVGDDADPRALATLREGGYDLSHAARRFESEWLERSHLILAMDRANYDALLELAERHDVAPEHVCLLRSFDPTAGPGAEVPDPYYGGTDGFAQVLDMIERAADGVVTHVRAELSALTPPRPMTPTPPAGPDLTPLGLQARRVTGIGGGDTCRAWQVELADGATAFVKQSPSHAGGMLDLEAAGLQWLSAGGATVPRVLGVGGGLLALSWIDSARATPEAAVAFGAMLARLHRTEAPHFGSAPPTAAEAAVGWVGAVRVPFGSYDAWPQFYVQNRLLPTAAAAADVGGLTTAMARAIDDLCDALLTDAAGVAGDPVAPAVVHGDLWSGNVMWQPDGAVLIDPAAHGGHPESDLAMLHLFGTPQLPRIVAGYESVRPLPASWRSRIALHQVFPLLVHAAMFGAGYGAQAADAARAAVAAGRSD